MHLNFFFFLLNRETALQFLQPLSVEGHQESELEQGRSVKVFALLKQTLTEQRRIERTLPRQC